jgi:hypothetical protein
VLSKVERLLELFEIGFRRVMTGPVWTEEGVSKNGMKMGMKPGIIREGLDHQDRARCAVTRWPGFPWQQWHSWLQELALVFEIDTQQSRHAEDKLSIRDGIEDLVGDVFPERNRIDIISLACNATFLL